MMTQQEHEMAVWAQHQLQHLRKEDTNRRASRALEKPPVARSFAHML